MHTKPTSPVKLSKETDPAKPTRISPRNLHARDNVNVAQGPRMGNEGAHSAKRGKFINSKEERAPLAKTIEDAYAKRQHEYKEFEYTNGGSIMDNVYEGKKKKK